MKRNENVCVKNTGRTGKGLFASRPFKKKDFIFLIAGPIMDHGTKYTVPIAKGIFIDTVPLDNFAKYINHSCDPNAGIKQRTMVVACRNIKEGEEVTIDYAMIVDEYGDELTEDELKCKCGSSKCRGRLGARSQLPEEIRKKYGPFVSEYLLDNDRGQ